MFVRRMKKLGSDQVRFRWLDPEIYAETAELMDHPLSWRQAHVQKKAPLVSEAWKGPNGGNRFRWAERLRENAFTGPLGAPAQRIGDAEDLMATDRSSKKRSHANVHSTIFP